MIFPSYVKNKVTQFSCRQGDATCQITYEYDIEGDEEFVKAFEIIAKFLGYSEDTLREYYREFNLEDASNDPELPETNENSL